MSHYLNDQTKINSISEHTIEYPNPRLATHTEHTQPQRPLSIYTMESNQPSLQYGLIVVDLPTTLSRFTLHIYAVLQLIAWSRLSETIRLCILIEMHIRT